ncbi:unnamed protein product [Cyprideis torosa]|uniref:Uncharacterized protein n=1 Tax=Cyprideis torosa TaxID=163714 RepID=A0A7R8ZPE0_9CRUS|nr:unnamed protein product [Cyprideis torosa]CAG0893736.1 unnamed protein product [Cyprideis torosa]
MAGAPVFVPISAEDVTAEWVQNVVLKGHIKEPFRVVDHTVSTVTKSDDREGFTSLMVKTETKTQVEGEEEPRTFNLYVKLFPPNEQHRAMVRTLNVFQRESHVYENFLRQIRDSQSGVGSPLEPLWPKCYYTYFDVAQNLGVVVLENLKVSGYQLMDRKVGLDRAHICLAMKAFARSHALSYHVKTTQGVEEYLLKNPVLLTDPMESVSGMIEFQLGLIPRTLSSTRDQREPLDEVLRIYYDTFFQYLKQLKNPLTISDYTFDELKADFEDFRKLGVAMMCFFVFGLTMEGKDLPNLEQMDEEPAKMVEKYVTEFEARPISAISESRLMDLMEDAMAHGVI